MLLRLKTFSVLLGLALGFASCEAAQPGETTLFIPGDAMLWPDRTTGDDVAEDSRAADPGGEVSPPCAGDDDCPDGVCDLKTGECVPCFDDDDCLDGMICLEDLNVCVECESLGDCPSGHVCEDHFCVPLCTPEDLACDGLDVIECAADGLSWLPAGTCDDDDSCTEDDCVAGKCINEALGGCCDPPCPLGQLCFDGECVCAAACMGKDCGDDGCGGSCGECPEQHHCSPAGLCICDPACADKQCGPDGCGSTCGTCAGLQDVCLDGQCICQPDCEGKDCGDDGCGGSCGTCLTQHECNDEGICVCVPDCAGKICGADGCDGSCGGCDGPLYICGDGQCVQDPTFAPVLDACSPHLHDQHVYYVCWESLRWDKAKDYCADHGTWLVTITSDDEQAFVAGLAAAVDQTLWIGLEQGFWEWDPFDWITGENVSVEYWGEGEPNDGGLFQSEDCGELAPSGHWNDNQCSEKQWFTCEYSL